MDVFLTELYKRYFIEKETLKLKLERTAFSSETEQKIHSETLNGIRSRIDLLKDLIAEFTDYIKE